MTTLSVVVGTPEGDQLPELFQLFALLSHVLVTACAGSANATANATANSAPTQQVLKALRTRRP